MSAKFPYCVVPIVGALPRDGSETGGGPDANCGATEESTGLDPVDALLSPVNSHAVDCLIARYDRG